MKYHRKALCWGGVMTALCLTLCADAFVAAQGKEDEVEAKAIGAPAKNAIGPLKKLLLTGDKKASERAARSLAKIGPEAIPALLEGTLSEVTSVKDASVMALVYMGAPAMPVFIKGLSDQRVEVRRQSAKALRFLRISDKDLAFALTDALKDSDSEVRLHAVQALPWHAAYAKQAVPELVSMLDTNPDLRLPLLTALYAIEGEADIVMPALTSIFKSDDPKIRCRAVRVLEKYGQASLPLLIQALRDKDESVQATALGILTVVKADIKDVLPALAPFLKNKSPIRQEAYKVLPRLGEAGLPILMSGLSDPEVGVKRESVNAFFKLGPTAVPALVAALDTKDPEMKLQIMLILRRMGPASNAAIPALTKLLEDDSPQIREEAKRALSIIQRK